MNIAIERLRLFYKRNNRLPSHREMVTLLHYKSKGSTIYFVQKLIEAGILAKDDAGKLIPKDLMSIPLLGSIKAGYPTPADAQYDSQVRLYELFDNISYGSFALKVSGDSMIDEGIHEGDLVIISKDVEAKTGDVVAAIVDGEWTVKYLMEKDGKVCLMPANKNYSTIYPTESLQIGGVVVSVIRKYH